MKPLTPQAAESLAIEGLAYLAAEDDLLMRFAGLTGILPNDMRQAATDPGFLVGVLDFYLSHEPDLLAWTQSANIDPELIMAARYTLAPHDSSGME